MTSSKHALDLPPELKIAIAAVLINDDADRTSLSSLALLWRETQNDIRAARFQHIILAKESSLRTRLESLLALIRAAPSLASYIRQITFGDVFLEGGGWITEPTICENLAELITLTTAADTLHFIAISSHVVPKVPRTLAVLHDALRAPRFKVLHLSNYAFVDPMWLFHYLGMLSSLEELSLRPNNDNEGSFEGPDPPVPTATVAVPNSRLKLLHISGAWARELEILGLVADLNLFPNVEDFALDTSPRLFSTGLEPTLGRLFVRWSSTLRHLQLSGISFSDTALVLPPSLISFSATICLLLSGPINSLASSLRTIQIQKVNIDVSYTVYSPHLYDRCEAELRVLDDALASCAGYLKWKGRYFSLPSIDAIVLRPGNVEELDRWLFAVAFPKVTKKFFSDMPAPVPGAYDEGECGSRCHAVYPLIAASDLNTIDN
ncbi:hypothetical protein CYLTODRAFT_488107 [Cylindrobasidium torrendii FP15055 ss-10]|uniref:F-box domain-containing protein n=1 Tax=Cylindrobasidium torrendii FP15055 ss-10 TaxID=1314674 RepID=A0A0D7BIP9_9AGAR|nr:hypothetical protein CYLTODRAFT_488107 [Cylindrobasidium torrendii FP15055 ss-10]